MRNINVLINILMDIMEDESLEFERIYIDDNGATEEAEIHYHIDCPYSGRDERALCIQGEKYCRDVCVKCKIQWLLAEVDK